MKYIVSIFVFFSVFTLQTRAYSIIDSVSTESAPRSIVALNGKIYVANAFSNSISVIDTVDNTVEEVISTGEIPFIRAVRNGKIYVAHSDDSTVLIVDTLDNNSVTTIVTGDVPNRMAVAGTRVLVSLYNTSNASVIYSDNSVGNIAISSISSQMISPYIDKVFTANFADRSVSVIDVLEGIEDEVVSLANRPTSLLEINEYVYILGKNPLNDDSDKIEMTSVEFATSSIAISNGVHSSFAAMDNLIFVSNSSLDHVQVIDTADSNSVTTIENISEAGALYVFGSKVFVDSADGLVAIDTENGNSTTIIEGVRAYSQDVFASIGTRLYVLDDLEDTMYVIETADTITPSISISTPNEGQIVEGNTVALSATASDDVFLSGVTFKLDDLALSSEDTSSPYSLSWDSTSVSDGVHTLSAVARDSSNNYATSSISITVKNQSARVSGSRSSVSSRNQTTNQSESVLSNPAPFLSPQETNPKVVEIRSKLQELLTELNKQLTKERGGESVSEFTRDLGKGMKGEDVKRLQKFLNSHGFVLASSGPGAPGFETNFFGNLLENALKRFQLVNQIDPVSGYFGEKTRNFIKKLLD